MRSPDILKWFQEDHLKASTVQFGAKYVLRCGSDRRLDLAMVANALNMFLKKWQL